VILPALARRARVCTYDRAGDALSDARPASVRPLTGATQARELRLNDSLRFRAHLNSGPE
jgi:hypothetical protein